MENPQVLEVSLFLFEMRIRLQSNPQQIMLLSASQGLLLSCSSYCRTHSCSVISCILVPSIMIYMLIIPKSMHSAQFSHKHFQPVSLNACRTYPLGRMPRYSLKNANVIVTLALSCLKPLIGSGLAPLFLLPLTHSVMPTGNFLAVCICIFFQFSRAASSFLPQALAHAVSPVWSSRSIFLAF